MSDTTLQAPATPDERKLNLVDHALVLIVICAIDLVVNAVNHQVGFLHNLTGMVVLYAICMAGLVLTRIMPFYLPSVAWISLVGMAVTLPFVPGSDWVVAQVTAIDFLALTTPTLAYAGFAIAREEIATAKTSGWKLAVVAVMVFFGTYLGSVLIAELMLAWT
ncbi:hypothetical protein P7L78_21015 [Tistrella bauzanensis]|jgi:hypothetical protein|uniref:Permease n=2 Tax=Tistrella TaxID=171436 RepID=A0ABU9YQV5_9PROT|nr:hypothetical protein [Tistrella bauzanensis]GGB45615.1 hypothetical protein GCM10011505_28570 [Tistrella bauzanensis]